MVWKKGERGDPKGEKVWRAAIVRALDRIQAGKIDYLAIDKVAEKLIDCATRGDMQAIKEIGDRLDGKPNQSLDIDMTKREIHVHIGLNETDKPNGIDQSKPAPETITSVH